MSAAPDTNDFPVDIAGLSRALDRQRQYTLDLYADLPAKYWEPANFPHLKIVNPPLWELAHIAWFAEFFCVRWRPDDTKGLRTRSCLPDSDALFDSAAVVHEARWRNRYPSRGACLDYMKRALDHVQAALHRSDSASRYPFQLAVAHEDMHAEALIMTLNTLNLPFPDCVPTQTYRDGHAKDIRFNGGDVTLGDSHRAFRFDNEMPAHRVQLAPFAISSQVISAAQFAEFFESADYDSDLFWSANGATWKRLANKAPILHQAMLQNESAPALHLNHFQAEAWCRWANRRLPTEAEWEFAAVRSPEFRASTGHVWEWTATAFSGYPGFSPGPYREYSEPWFSGHQVLRGGSFATNQRLKYPQYRNFYTPERNDMFCGFRTCATAF